MSQKLRLEKIEQELSGRPLEFGSLEEVFTILERGRVRVKDLSNRRLLEIVCSGFDCDDPRGFAEDLERDIPGVWGRLAEDLPEDVLEAFPFMAEIIEASRCNYPGPGAGAQIGNTGNPQVLDFDTKDLPE